MVHIAGTAGNSKTLSASPPPKMRKGEVHCLHGPCFDEETAIKELFQAASLEKKADRQDRGLCPNQYPPPALEDCCSNLTPSAPFLAALHKNTGDVAIKHHTFLTFQINMKSTSSVNPGASAWEAVWKFGCLCVGTTSPPPPPRQGPLLKA
eukprot:1158991-Pelagomonas_calceolata.AAC.12